MTSTSSLALIQRRNTCSSQHIGQLLRAYDIEVSELAIRVIFYACLPSTSLNASPLEADWKEGVEVSLD